MDDRKMGRNAARTQGVLAVREEAYHVMSNSRLPEKPLKSME